MRELVLAAFFGLSGCALYQRLWDQSVREHGHCQVLCDRYSGIPATSAWAAGPNVCRCQSVLTKMERVLAKDAPDYVEIECAHGCKRLVENLGK